MRVAAIAAALITTLASADTPRVELIGIATLPAETFATGPPSGQWDDDGRRRAAPRFARQPVQGISAIQRGPPPGTWWALSDNGFATPANSPDYRAALYLFAARPGRVQLRQRIALRDPARHFPWRLVEEHRASRPFTGADIDPESLVQDADGSFWIGDEIGPWLLHFAANGTLLAPPVELQIDGQPQLSVNHPLVRAGRARAQLGASRGFEGLAAGPQPGTLLAMLEGAALGAAPDEARLIEFVPATGTWTGRSWRYPLDAAAHHIAELVPAWPASPPATVAPHWLVIERDDTQGDSARVKRIYEIDLAQADAAGRLQKTLRVDLLDIADPLRLASSDGRFRFPFITTEAMLPLGPDTLLVVNDNNYPATGGRGDGVRDGTEWIWLRLR